jgi:hypothetical protein
MGGDRGPVALAIDIGGTFTDLAAVDRRDGSLVLAKVDTTPSRLQLGVMTALHRSELRPDDVGAFIHGSTVVINAITERRGARTALVTTEGFRDVLEIGRANRPDLYNLSYRKPEPFVPRRLRFEVRERISHTGSVLVPLDEPAVERPLDLRSARAWFPRDCRLASHCVAVPSACFALLVWKASGDPKRGERPSPVAPRARTVGREPVRRAAGTPIDHSGTRTPTD